MVGVRMIIVTLMDLMARSGVGIVFVAPLLTVALKNVIVRTVMVISRVIIVVIVVVIVIIIVVIVVIMSMCSNTNRYL